MAKASYQASPIKRRRRTQAQVNQLDLQILAILKEDRPQSIRHIFYRLTDPRIPEPVDKSDQGYAQVQDRITKLRRSGALPYGWISDASRRGYFVDTFDDASDFLRRMSGLYRADLWSRSDHHCEVWVESRSIASVIQNDCEELAVSLYPAGGFTSLSLAYQAAEFINARRDGKPVAILYVGDYDPAGVLIDVSIQRELRTHLRNDIDLSFTRLGITPEQVREFGLPTKPRKTGDRRSPEVEETVEAEAMPAAILRGIVRNAVEALLPSGALEAARAAEQSERGHIGRIAAMIASGDAG